MAVVSIPDMLMSVRAITLTTARIEHLMNKETPSNDPRQKTDWKSPKQTDEPWKGNPEKEQRPGGPPPDLEEWQESSTH
jgi:hypothetical protein